MALRDLLDAADPAMREAAVVHGISVIVAVACCVFALAVPAVYYVLQQVHIKSDMRVEAVTRARSIDTLIARRPDAWRVLHSELSAVLDERLLVLREVEVHILDPQGALIAASSMPVPPPHVVERAPLHQAGTVVGYVEVTGTLYPMLLNTTLAASLGALLGIVLYGLMKNVPLTALQQAMKQLREQTARAEQANAAKSTFLASMSHEIRTPMNGVIGMTGLLLGTALNREQQEYVETIRTSGNTLLTVINDVLDFSKMESGNMQLESQPFELARCIEDVFSIVATAAQKKHLELLYLIENEVPPWLEGDVTRLRQVLVNLVNNGVKFTERGEIYVHVTRRAGSDGDIEFAVKDTGIGIPAAAQAALFKPFSQVDAGAARKYEGTGLGLAICVRLVKLMGGDIRVASEAGTGSTFTFTISAAAAAARDTRPDQFAIHGKRVLLVDDNDTVLRILTVVLSRWGLACDLAASPAQALTLLRSDTVYDVGVLDFYMPGMDGALLAREIRKIAAREKLPLVLFTSVEGAATSAADDTLFAAKLTKPLRQSQLFETLNGLFGGHAVPLRVKRQQTVSPAQRDARARLTMLVAEDNPVNTRLVTVMLDKLGYRADFVGSGVEAVAALKQRSYDVVLMDVQMPEMDGVEATRRIRAAQKAGVQPYVIAVTANVLYEDRQSYLEAGMNGFLGKPFTMEELDVALSEALRVHAGTRGAAAAPPATVAAKTTPPTPATGALLDRACFEDIKILTGEAGPDVFDSMIRNLEKDLQAFDTALGGWLCARDANGMTRAAHSLKGSSHSLGAQALGNLFGEIETLAKAGQLDEASRHYSEGKTISARSIQALQQPVA